MKYAVINTLNALPNHVGVVESIHRTEKAAKKADDAIQRTVRKYNSKGSYLPTIIRQVEDEAEKGMMIPESLIIEDHE